ANPLTNTNSVESAAVAFTTNASGSLATPTISTGATRIGTYGFTANWDAAITNATSYLIKVYQGSTLVNATYAPGASIIKSVIGANLLPNTAYTYTVSAIAAATPNFESVESAPSPVFTTQVAGYALQYADSTGLKNEIKYGIADVYELTSSGATYILVPSASATGLIISRGFTLRGQTGLSAKPIFSYSNTSTSSTLVIFSTTTPGLNMSFENLELNGTNAGSGGQALIFTATNSTTWATVAIKNCKVYNFINGNGIFRLEGPSTVDGVNKTTVTLLNSTFDNCAGRFIHLYSASLSSSQKYGAVTLTNCTFSNFTLTTASNPNAIIFYRSATQKALATSLTVNHCTFYGFNSSNNIITIQNQSPGGPVTMSSPVSIKNSIFDCGSPAYAMTYTAQTANTTIFDNCWTSNFSTPLVPAVNSVLITNPFVASPVPTYTSISTKDFSLSNKSSFICTDGYVAGNINNAVLTALAPPSTINDANSGAWGFSASWSAVTGATGYLVNVYSGSTIVASSRVSVANVSISNLTPNITYAYKVIAIGDGVNFSSSVESAASNAFSTSFATVVNSIKAHSFITAFGKTIISSETGLIQVYSIQGAKIIEAPAVSTLNTNLANGIYLVKLTATNGLVTNAKVQIK
ncbi:MAG: T9SS type A sorting domain-containing protein, partial [Paludibacter sp.]